MNAIKNIIARELSLSESSVANTMALLDEGCTIPFISRYRKERTGSLDEVQVESICNQYDKLKELTKRKETILDTINKLGKLTAELQARIDNCWDSTTLEDIYMPFKPKHHTKAQIAREQGLEPLASLIMLQRERDIRTAAKRFIKGDVKNVDDALKGAQYIIAETISEDETTRAQLRNRFHREAVIASKVVKGKEQDESAAKYQDYFEFSEPLRRCSGNRFLAMLRGENEGFLKVSISVEADVAIEQLRRHYVHGYGPCGKLIEEAINDAYKRLLKPSIENEVKALRKEKADDEAIQVFSDNARQLLLAAPLGQKSVMGVDPGIRTGCKVVCLDSQGNLLYNDVVYPFPPKGNHETAAQKFATIAKKYKVEAIAIGNGTASRETTDVLKSALQQYTSPATANGQVTDSPRPDIFVVSEDGASIYSASKVARDEFPEYDVTVRGAVSIGRRLMDPLAELVKIDPKSIGVGQYQHDVDQTKLKKSLDQTVESCVNLVGVNANTASQQLLTYVSGLGPTIAKNLVEYRQANGDFNSRAQLKKVPRLGPTTFQQCAGFLRVPNSRNPLDNSAVHPESYTIVERMAKDCSCTVSELIHNKPLQKTIDLKRYVTTEIGLPTLTDIMKELDKPGRDPRPAIEVFEFSDNVKVVSDLIAGMVLPGIVTNITKFGVFVDIGVHQDGLVHISQLANHFIADPSEVVHLHQQVKVKVLDVDLKRNRISLSMKEV